jgi:hypothetical protein
MKFSRRRRKSRIPAISAGGYILLAGCGISSQLKDLDVHRYFAVENVQSEVNQLRTRSFVGESKPLEALYQGLVGVFRGRRDESALVAGTEDRLPEFKLLRLLPGGVRLRGNHRVALGHPYGTAIDRYGSVPGRSSPRQTDHAASGSARAQCDIEVEVSRVKGLGGHNAASVRDRGLNLRIAGHAVERVHRDRDRVGLACLKIRQRKLAWLRDGAEDGPAGQSKADTAYVEPVGGRDFGGLYPKPESAREFF